MRFDHCADVGGDGVEMGAGEGAEERDVRG